MGDVEIGGVLARLEHGAAEIALLLQQHCRRQVARVGVDGVAEQQSCTSGIMMIMANETRSRLSWMNSLISIAQVRRQKSLKRRDERRRGSLMIAVTLIGNCPWRAP